MNLSAVKFKATWRDACPVGFVSKRYDAPSRYAEKLSRGTRNYPPNVPESGEKFSPTSVLLPEIRSYSKKIPRLFIDYPVKEWQVIHRDNLYLP
jgi:hypothetical protein